MHALEKETEKKGQIFDESGKEKGSKNKNSPMFPALISERLPDLNA